MTKVYFISAGPGDPELITVKAAKILSQADVIVVDRLVSDEILNTYGNQKAKIFFVGKQGRCHASTIQSEINELLLSLSRQSNCLVRLKGGDTAFFSNIMDELSILHENNISYEIVPGVTAASGASAYTGVPLTARGYATGVQFLSCCSRSAMSEEEWKSAALMNNTLVWYMASKDWPSIARKLIHTGADGQTPMLVVEQASTPEQYVHQFILEDFMSEQTKMDWMSPSLIIVGKVVAMYEQFSWIKNESRRNSYFQSLYEGVEHHAFG